MSTAQRYFGIDYGTRKLGIAVGQTLTRTAMGIAVVPVRNGEPDWPQLDQLVKHWKPQALVIGMPYNMDGTDSDIMVRVQEFAQGLSERYQLPWHGVDERLSTREAKAISRHNADLSGKRYNDRGQVDAMAAQLLLESWFENH
jgi:putative holliday junction resolvase